MFPGGILFIDYNPVGLFLLLATPVVISISSYFFGKEWGVERLIVASIVPAVTFFLLEYAVVILASLTGTGGYEPSGGGALFEFMYVPGFIFVLSVILAAIGGSKKRAAEKRETGHLANKVGRS